MPGLLLCLLLFTADAQGVVGSVSGSVPQQQPRDPRAKPQTGTGSISGRVTAADSGVPLRRALVNLNGPSARGTYTDHEGRYQFNNLPPGSYHIFVTPGNHRAGYQAIQYGASPSSAAFAMRPKPMELKDGQKLENIDVALPRTGVISGRVTALDGEPASRVQVGAWFVPPGAEPSQRGSAQTDDLGQFRIFGLAPGDYFLMANPGMGGGMQAEIEGEPIGFAPTYAPGTPLRSEAVRLRVTRGGEASADIRLTETRVYSIRGTVVNSKNEPAPGMNVMLMRGEGTGMSSFGAPVSPAGTFIMRNVPPGQYELVARYSPPRAPGTTVQGPDSGQEFASVPVEIGMGDVEGVVLVTRPGATVTGEIVLDEPAQGLRPTVFAQPVARQPFVGPPRVEVKELAFTMRNVVGPLVLRGGASGPGWGLKAVLLRGKDITDVPTTFTDSDSGHLQVVFTAHAPSVEGAVMDETGKPVEEAAILLFGQDPSTWTARSSYLRTGQMTKDGKFTVAGLREGRYFVVAVPPEFGMSMTQPNAEFIESLSKVATAVTLNAGEKRSVDLVLVRFQER